MWVTKRQVLELGPCQEWYDKIVVDFPQTDKVSLAIALELAGQDAVWLISHMFSKNVTYRLFEAVKNNPLLRPSCAALGMHALGCYNIADKRVRDFVVEWLEAHNETP